MKEITAFRRKKFLIKKGFQLRYIGLTFLLVIVASGISGYTVFATGWTLLGEKLANVYPQGRLLFILKAVNFTLLRNIMLVSPLIFLLGLLSSHKIAGPVYRIEKSVGEISEGNLALKIKLRPGDELVDLADAINIMTENLNNSINIDKETVTNIQKDLDGIKSVIAARQDDPK
ncbi:MAG: HAMP domain-containing protein, partial [Candidatus Omnitrophota bacterium]|nr:HAMP domain-containing protein [Candidatus Omnitrophota bacterium]